MKILQWNVITMEVFLALISCSLESPTRKCRTISEIKKETQLKTSVGTIDSNLECKKKTGPLWSEMLIFQGKNNTRSLRPRLQKPFELGREGFSSSCIYSSYLSNKQGDLACSSEPASAVKPQSRKTKKAGKERGMKHSASWRSLRITGLPLTL